MAVMLKAHPENPLKSPKSFQPSFRTADRMKDTKARVTISKRKKQSFPYRALRQRRLRTYRPYS